MDAQAGANTPEWLHQPATRLEQASTDVLEKKMTDFGSLIREARSGSSTANQDLLDSLADAIESEQDRADRAESAKYSMTAVGVTRRDLRKVIYNTSKRDEGSVSWSGAENIARAVFVFMATGSTDG